MKNFTKILICTMIGLFSLLLTDKVKADFYTEERYPTCTSGGYSVDDVGSTPHDYFCKLYDTDGNIVYCLEIEKEISGGTLHTYQSTVTGQGQACGVLEAMNDGLISTPTSDGTYEYKTVSSDNNFYEIQKRIWDYEGTTASCSKVTTTPSTSTKDLAKGSIGISADSISMSIKTIDGVAYFAGIISLNPTNIDSYKISNSNSNLIISTTEKGSNVTSASAKTLYVRIPVSKVTSNATYNVSFSADYDSKETTTTTATTTITPFIKKYYHKSDRQLLGTIGLTKSTTTSTSKTTSTDTATDSVKLTATLPNANLTLKKVDTSGTAVSGAIIKITKDGSAFKTETMTSGTLSITSGLSYGKYCVTEVTAPSGYIKTNISECVTLSSTNPNGTITITNNKTQVSFNKLDAVTNEVLPGATLRILNSNKQAVGCSTCEWTSGTGIHTITGLPVGTYYLEEVSAPEGYILITTPVQFTINSDGSITSESKSGSTIVMRNIKISTSFSKIDAATKKALSGATLQILDKDKKVILDENGKPKYQWISATEAHVIDALPVGTYYLKEISAPEGYSLNSDPVEFTINKDGSVTVKDQNSKETMVVIMENEKTVTSFSKQDATTGKELPGATLQILDKDKKEIKDKDGKVLYKWVSTDKPYVIEGLPVGTYYLKETIQPKGYELNEELVKFEVKADGTVTKVVMKNTPIVDVPDTALSSSTILIILGSIIGLAGIGLIVYTIIKRKNSKV